MTPDLFFTLPLETVLGYFAASLTTISFLPQVIQVYRTKNTDAISFWMYLIFSVGVFFWFIYGVMIQAWPVVIANAITLLLSLSILWMKVNEKSH
jgi:MtN3 and saliva related transmembrane protein